MENIIKLGSLLGSTNSAKFMLEGMCTNLKEKASKIYSVVLLALINGEPPKKPAAIMPLLPLEYKERDRHSVRFISSINESIEDVLEGENEAMSVAMVAPVDRKHSKYFEKAFYPYIVKHMHANNGIIPSIEARPLGGSRAGFVFPKRGKEEAEMRILSALNDFYSKPKRPNRPDIEVKIKVEQYRPGDDAGDLLERGQVGAIKYSKEDFEMFKSGRLQYKHSVQQNPASPGTQYKKAA